MSKKEIIKKLLQQSIKNYLRQHNMKHIRLAGSFVRGEEHHESDIDIVYEYDQNEYFERGPVDVKLYLENIFKRNVDVLDKDFLPKNIQPFILSEMEAIW